MSQRLRDPVERTAVFDVGQDHAHTPSDDPLLVTQGNLGVAHDLRD
jgi:hypothetical protein